MKRLEDNFNYYSRQYQYIVSNKNSYTSTRTEKHYGPWKRETWQVSGEEIFSTKSLGWWYGVPWKRGRSGQHMKNDEETREDIRQTLATKLGYSVDCIMIDPYINPRGNTPTHPTGCGDAIMFSSYNIGYKYRHLLENRVETYFDQEKYNKALNDCESNINSARVAILRFKQEEAHKATVAEAARIEEIRKQQLDKGRSEFLVKFFDQANFVMNQIKAKGFDANYLAYLSIQNSHDELFSLSLEEGAELESYQLEGKTLIQHIIHAANEAFLQKAMSVCSDLSITAIGAIEQGDLLTIETLHAYNANFLQITYQGQTLLQAAISNNSAIEIIQKLIELDNSCCSILSDNGESALKIAAENGNDKIIKLIESQVRIKEEIEQLGSDVDSQLKAKILINQDMETLIRLFKGENISLDQYIDLTNEVCEDCELHDIEDRVDNTQIISVLEQSKQQDEEIAPLSGQGANENFFDFGYE